MALFQWGFGASSSYGEHTDRKGCILRWAMIEKCCRLVLGVGKIEEAFVHDIQESFSN